MIGMRRGGDRRTLGRGGIGNLLSVLISAGQEENVAGSKAMITSDHISDHCLVGVAKVRGPEKG